MNSITLTNLQIYSNINQDKKVIGKVYFTGADYRGNGKQLVSITATGSHAEALNNVFKKGDFINITGRLNTYNVKNYNISITFLEKSVTQEMIDRAKK